MENEPTGRWGNEFSVTTLVIQILGKSLEVLMDRVPALGWVWILDFSIWAGLGIKSGSSDRIWALLNSWTILVK